MCNFLTCVGVIRLYQQILQEYSSKFDFIVLGQAPKSSASPEQSEGSSMFIAHNI